MALPIKYNLRNLMVRRGTTLTTALGIALTVRKELPLSAGQGGSAASAVAGAVATNALCGSPLPTEALLDACLLAESTVAGRHLDNLAPSLLGGICLVLTRSRMERAHGRAS